MDAAHAFRRIARRLDRALGVLNLGAKEVTVLKSARRRTAFEVNEDPAVVGGLAKSALQAIVLSARFCAQYEDRECSQAEYSETHDL